ncbi:hypothetical protein ACFU9C_43650, partial [Streptomyces sp. NPDC057580]
CRPDQRVPPRKLTFRQTIRPETVKPFWSATGWELHAVVGTNPSSLSRPIAMADLLSGIYALAEQGERWQELMLATLAERNQSPQQRQDLNQALAEREPGFAKDLAAAEGFFTGPGSLEDLSLFFY